MTGATAPTVLTGGRVLVSGTAAGEVLASRQPLSFWGGVDPATGLVIDQRHQLCGASVAGRVVVLPRGRGSTTSSYVLLDAWAAGTGPAALLLHQVDEVMALAAVVREELYAVSVPVLVLDNAAFERALLARWAEVRADGTVVLVG